MFLKKTIFFVFVLSFSLWTWAEDGSRLWLPAGTGSGVQISANQKSSTIDVAVNELKNHWRGAPVQLKTVRTKEMQSLGKDGYIITGNTQAGISLAAPSDAGLLYGVYHLLRLQETGLVPAVLNIKESPKYKYRLLNHWDNLDGTVERGYAGHSIWCWDELPGIVSPRYKVYARANASIGINGTVLNNVNASPQFLTTAMLEKAKAIADELRPYGIQVYLSVNFSSPVLLGGLKTSDPLNPEVQKWWITKADEIYRFIPDFGGFLVKANSEGQPGPQDFGRTHVDGANMLADALKPHKGIVMWRAFVYNPNSNDRAKQAYLEFTPFDGQFRDNVVIQVKNGPVDFQPREPFSPLFGAMEKTPLTPELQITQEYLGESYHLVFLASLWKEFLDNDTYCAGKGSLVAQTTDGAIYSNPLTAIAGVANIGEDVNWCGHIFAQANWYAFGRLAWNHRLTPAEIAEEWLRMTFSSDTAFIRPVKEMMLASREATVNYMMPLGLNCLFAWDHHYGPEPWCNIPGVRADWLPGYYHQANNAGVGFDRTVAGSDAVSQYHSPLKEKWNDIKTCPENLLAWFHHVSWNHRMESGRTFWDELCYRYDSGVQQVREFQKIWDRQESRVDPERFRQVQSRLKIQSRDAVWWKDACLLYFQTFSKQPIPYDVERPIHELDELKNIKLDMKNHN